MRVEKTSCGTSIMHLLFFPFDWGHNVTLSSLSYFHQGILTQQLKRNQDIIQQSIVSSNSGILEAKPLTHGSLKVGRHSFNL